MKSLVIYDSVFGNTKLIASNIARGLGASCELLSVTDFIPDKLNGIDLLVIGSPTRGFRPTPAITSLMESFPDRRLSGMKVAAFDTRIDTKDIGPKILKLLVNFFGYAAKPIADRLKRKGGILISEPKGFFVKDKEGPLKIEEEQFALEWGKELKKKFLV